MVLQQKAPSENSIRNSTSHTYSRSAAIFDIYSSNSSDLSVYRRLDVPQDIVGILLESGKANHVVQKHDFRYSNTGGSSEAEQILLPKQGATESTCECYNLVTFWAASTMLFQPKNHYSPAHRSKIFWGVGDLPNAAAWLRRRRPFALCFVAFSSSQSASCLLVTKFLNFVNLQAVWTGRFNTADCKAIPSLRPAWAKLLQTAPAIQRHGKTRNQIQGRKRTRLLKTSRCMRSAKAV